MDSRQIGLYSIYCLLVFFPLVVIHVVFRCQFVYVCAFREASANGETEDNSISENPLSLGDKRFLLQPAVDRILLQKVFVQPRTQ